MGACDSKGDRPSRHADPTVGAVGPAKAGAAAWCDLQRVIDALPNPIFIKDSDLLYAGCNRAYAELIVGDTRESIIGKTVYQVAAPELAAGYDAADRALYEDGGTQRYETRIHYRDGTLHDIELYKAVVYDGAGNKLGLVGTMLDITERRRREAEVERLAHFDVLTGLPNRRLLQERAEIAVAGAVHTADSLGVFYLDLDRFKDINDTRGHDVGDQLLVQVSTRLRQGLRERDMLARLGGDEFAVLLPNADRGELTSTARRLLRCFEPPFHVDGRAIRLGASIGVVTCPHDGATLGELLKHADIAMYRAKAEGTGFVLFEAAHRDEIRERVDLELDLTRALEADAITLAFQPRVNAGDGRVDSLEALARWRHPRRGPVPPLLFIPLAEATGLIHRLGQRVLMLACRQLVAWRAVGIDVRVAVNISARELQRPGFADDFLDTLARHGVPGSALEVELTETALMASPEDSVLTLERLRLAGVHTAVDDFGTGYSSLTHLKRLSVDTLKVDQGFVADMTTDAVDADIVETIIALARSLGLNTVAEGVETEAQERALLALGCNMQQGYRFCRPMPAPEIERWLRHR